MNNNDQNEEQLIAVIGMAGQFPGAKNIADFWQNLVNEVESIRSLSDEELREQGISAEVIKNPNYVNATSSLEDINLFAANFFDINAEEAAIIDPQHRLLLEYSFLALEDAGYPQEEDDKRIAVYSSVGISHYLLNIMAAQPDLIHKLGLYQVLLGNDKSYAATRISHALNLTGPSINIDTACSSSLVAIAQAVKSLLSYECDMALAGGAKINIPQNVGYLWHEGGIFSKDGHCRPFDANASGTIFASGIGMVVLKRLTEAKSDGDHIYAVIRGVAVNNDGAKKISYMAPSIGGQASVIAEAIAVAEVAPESISYIETHGTGTSFGDAIEVSALNDVFKAATTKTGFCAIGSLKSNIGYLEVASGVAGFIKTVLALQQKKIPASLNFEQANPEIDFTLSPFYVNTQLQDWSSSLYPRRAGVSSFGIGGTNAHVILEEWPDTITNTSSRSQELIILSAKTPQELAKKKIDLANYLEQYSRVNMADVAFTLQLGRLPYNYRCAFICSNQLDAITQLRAPSLDLSQPLNIPKLPDVTFLSDELLVILQQIWLSGIDINWKKYYQQEQRSRLSLPGYPFIKQKCWIDLSSFASNQLLDNAEKITNYAVTKKAYVAPRNELEKKLAALWGQVLSLSEIGIYDHFFEIGGNSFLAIKLINAANSVGLTIKPMQLFRHPTIAELAEIYDADLNVDMKTNHQLAKEIVFPEDLQLSKPKDQSSTQAIFFTGGTGFLGAFLLDKLIKTYPQAKIYCLVRADDIAAANERLKKNLQHYGLWQENYSRQIVAIPGDLEKPSFGLTAAKFLELATIIDVIVHCGAVVNFVSSYEQLKPANVDGTIEILRLSSQIHLKPVHYISTISVFPAPQYIPNNLAKEDDTLDFDASYKGGYAQSKWVAEKIILLAQSRGFPVAIYRPGRVTGCTKTGVWNTSDFLCKVIKGCVQLGFAPKTNFSIDFTPVNYVSDAIVEIMQQPAQIGKTFHLLHPKFINVKKIINYVNSIGYSVKEIPYNNWYSLLLETIAQQEENALQVVIDLFEPSTEEDPWEKNVLNADCRQAIAALENTDVKCPAAENLLPIYFNYLIQSNFLPKKVMA